MKDRQRQGEKQRKTKGDIVPRRTEAGQNREKKLKEGREIAGQNRWWLCWNCVSGLQGDRTNLIKACAFP